MLNQVVVAVRGGVAYIEKKPKGVEVVVRDYDNEGGVIEENAVIEEIYRANEEVDNG